MIAPPYSTEFVQLFLPIVRNEEITGRLRSADHSDDVSLFLGEKLLSIFFTHIEAALTYRWIRAF